jgi:hypothetical protein
VGSRYVYILGGVMPEKRKYWQQAAGDIARNYADVCLKWDVILNGPGYLGAWPECTEKLRL